MKNKKEYKTWLEAVKKNGMSLRYIENQTEELCLAAVKQNPNAFRYVKHKTDEVLRAAREHEVTVEIRKSDINEIEKRMNILWGLAIMVATAIATAAFILIINC